MSPEEIGATGAPDDPEATVSPLPHRPTEDIVPMPATAVKDVDEPRLFDIERYAPKIQVGLMLRLPASNARDFLVAASLGSTLNKDGTRGPMKDRENGGGVVIGRKHRERILACLQISPRHWRRLLDDWVARYTAHRCQRGLACLFTMNLIPEDCPACREPLEYRQAPPRPDLKKRNSGRIRSGQTDVVRPLKRTQQVRTTGTNTSASRHESDIPQDGNQQGNTEGIEVLVLESDEGCVRCTRYGRDHVGKHRPHWAGQE